MVKEKSKRIVIWIVNDFRRHFSLLFGVVILVIPNIFSNPWIPHCSLILETLIALSAPTLWLSSYKRKCQVPPCPLSEEGARTQGSGLRKGGSFALLVGNLNPAQTSARTEGAMRPQVLNVDWRTSSALWTHTWTFLDLGVSQRHRKAETEAGKERKWVKALPHLREMAAEGKGRKKWTTRSCFINKVNSNR